MSATVTISILLRKKYRTPKGLNQVLKILESLEIRTTTQGRTTISGRMQIDAFNKLFKVSPIPVEPRQQGESDFGLPGGYTTASDLKPPTQLKEYVEVISVVPPAVRFR
jgi:hypothetical protein